jgi:hypothetical protein
MAAGKGKRPHQVIDLTDDDAGSHRSAKAARTNAPASSSQNSIPRSSQLSSHIPPSSVSSAPPRPGPYSQEDRASWQHGSQNDEVELVDLTQDDGPEFETYGTFGKSCTLFEFDDQTR